LLSSGLWFWNDYQIYASIILFTTLLSLITTLYDSYKNMKNLRKMSFFSCEVNVFRGVKDPIYINKDKREMNPNINIYKKSINSLDLVPGDLIEIPDNLIMPCDLIVLNGTCIMNECMLTGESIPVIKNALPYNNLIFNPNEDNKSSVLYAGTLCLETRLIFFRRDKINKF
jgi:cation-transporting ATPase 13A2